MDQALLVLTNCPDATVAESIARTLVGERLAACVNVLAPCRSFYAWQGKFCDEPEVPLLIKTTAAGYPALEARLRGLHPYELPEILAVDIAQGLPAYLGWVAGQVAAPRAGD
jgi:periplasmic divalent cation tolerance protein